METRNIQTAERQTVFNAFAGNAGGDPLTQKRLDALLALNAATAREKSLFASEQTRVEAASMQNPLMTKQAFAYFGLLLGVFPPAAIFTRVLVDAGNLRERGFWILGVLAIINLITAVVGYFSGKLIGMMIGELEKTSWTKMLLALPFIGILWGILAGGAGGVIVFIFGAVFGAMLGAAVGSVAVPVFTIFHRLLKRGDAIEQKHFLPFAFGVAFIISAFILGL